MTNPPAEAASDDLPGTSAFREQRDWAMLRRGQAVELRRGNTLIRRGTVDDLTPDATMLWLSHHGAENREIIHPGDGYQLWVASSTGPQDRPSVDD